MLLLFILEVYLILAETFFDSISFFSSYWLYSPDGSTIPFVKSFHNFIRKAAALCQNYDWNHLFSF